MAGVTGPLLSLGASGSIAKTQVYSTWKGRAYVRRHVIPSNPNTVDQQATRSTFSWLQQVFKRMPADVLLSWNAYADVNRFTGANGFIKQNLAALIGEADLTNLVLSPPSRAGLPALSAAFTPGNDLVSVEAVPPSLPAGWAVSKMICCAIRQQDPQTGTLYPIFAETDATDPYEVDITGLASAQTYVCGAWFEYTKPDGVLAYGAASQGTALTT